MINKIKRERYYTKSIKFVPLSAYQRFENNDHFVNIVMLYKGKYE